MCGVCSVCGVCGVCGGVTMNMSTEGSEPKQYIHAYVPAYVVYECTIYFSLMLFTCSVNVHVKRIGGGYGAKISRSHMVTAACALGAYVTRRSVHVFAPSTDGN